MLYPIRITDEKTIETIIINEKYGNSCQVEFIAAAGTCYKLLELKPIYGELAAWQDLTEGAFPDLKSMIICIRDRLDPTWTSELANKILLNKKASAEFKEIVKNITSHPDEYYDPADDDSVVSQELKAEILDDGSLRLYMDCDRKTAAYIAKPGEWKFKKRFRS